MDGEPHRGLLHRTSRVGDVRCEREATGPPRAAAEGPIRAECEAGRKTGRRPGVGTLPAAGHQRPSERNADLRCRTRQLRREPSTDLERELARIDPCPREVDGHSGRLDGERRRSDGRGRPRDHTIVRQGQPGRQRAARHFPRRVRRRAFDLELGRVGRAEGRRLQALGRDRVRASPDIEGEEGLGAPVVAVTEVDPGAPGA